MAVAIITGASRGLGLALAAGLAGAGWRLVVDARDADALAAAGRAAAATGGGRPSLPGDVTDPAHRRGPARGRRPARRRSTCWSTTPASSGRARSRRSPTTRSTRCATCTR